MASDLLIDDLFGPGNADALEALCLSLQAEADKAFTSQHVVASTRGEFAPAPHTSSEGSERLDGDDARSGSAQSWRSDRRRGLKKSDPHRGAKMARLNRERHKDYVAALEAAQVHLASDKEQLQRAQAALTAELAAARAEIARLRNTLAHQSTISQALERIGSISMSFSDAGCKRAAEDDAAPHTRFTLPMQFNITLPM